jgi:hypothetical protein
MAYGYQQESYYGGVAAYCPSCGQYYYRGSGHQCLAQGNVYNPSMIQTTSGVYDMSDYNQIMSKKMCESTTGLKEKFLISLKPEPQKSFRKAGITNGDDMLTQEGRDVFLSWLLAKYGTDFKKEVVDEILKDKEEKK